MALPLPKYIEQANIVGSAIRHKWSDPGTSSQFMGDERLANRIRKISPQGIAVLCAGCVEWIAWRLSKEFKDQLFLNYVEAACAGAVDLRYMRPRKTVPKAPYLLEDWEGPVRAPVIKTCNDLEAVFKAVKKGRPGALTATIISQVALYVMPTQDPFKEWRRFAVERLAALHPAGKEGEPGSPVPREALNPDLDYKPAMADALLNNFLQGLDPGQNPFLKRPEEMKAEGFEGIPYTYKT